MNYQRALRSNIGAEMGRLDLNQATVSAAIGLSATALSARLNGHTDFKVGELVALATVLKVSVKDLVDGIDELPESALKVSA